MTQTPLTDIEARALMMRRLFIFALITLAGLIIGSVVIALVMTDPPVTPRIRLATIVQDLLVFILPPVAAAVIFSRYPARFLSLDRSFSLLTVALAMTVLIVSVPLQNCIIAWNEQLTLPESMSSVARWMHEAEQRAAGSTSLLMGGTSVADLIVSLLIVGVMAGLGEELFFRGALQRILTATPRGAQTAVWVSAVIFSAFHMQFFGFFPRLLLGAFFGYIVLWSGSLWPAVIVHAFNNSVVVITSWQSRRPGEVNPVEGFGAESPLLLAVSLLLTVGALWLLRRCARRGVSQTCGG